MEKLTEAKIPSTKKTSLRMQMWKKRRLYNEAVLFL